MLMVWSKSYDQSVTCTGSLPREPVALRRRLDGILAVCKAALWQ